MYNGFFPHSLPVSNVGQPLGQHFVEIDFPLPATGQEIKFSHDFWAITGSVSIHMPTFNIQTNETGKSMILITLEMETLTPKISKYETSTDSVRELSYQYLIKDGESSIMAITPQSNSIRLKSVKYFDTTLGFVELTAASKHLLLFNLY